MKNLYFTITGTVCLITLLSITTYGQGCVAIRSGCGANMGGGALLSQNQWQAGANLRYFHSYRHFRGTHEETNRVSEGSEVINDSFFSDFLISYGITNRLTANITLPLVYHNRSSLYEHGGNPSADDPGTSENESWAGDRNATSSRGIGDIRLGISYWLFDVSSSSNLAASIGLKLPTGDFRAQDQFHNQGDDKNETIRSGVDQSIQPGDGGTGATVELQGFHPVSDRIMLSANVYYLINPKAYYTLENRGRIRDYSVPDQYAARVGALVMLPLHGLHFYGGGRIEGVPASDLIGGDEGFRRPGYAISIEPGISYGIRNTSINLTVPVAIERNRTKSFSDKQTGRHGDAAFADYLINLGISFRFGGHTSSPFQHISDPLDLN